MKPSKKVPVKKASPKTVSPIGMDKQWQAENDARTLMEAERIKADRMRLRQAKVHAAKQAKEALKVGKL
jgi:hypothetical protein